MLMNMYKMVLQQVYKNVYYDTEDRQYYFVDENDKRVVVDQQSYLLIYIIELLQGGKK